MAITIIGNNFSKPLVTYMYPEYIPASIIVNSSAVPTAKQVFTIVLVELIAVIGIIELMLLLAVIAMCVTLRSKVILVGITIFQTVQLLHLLTCGGLLWLFIQGWGNTPEREASDICLLFSIIVGSHYAGINYMALALLITAIFPSSTKKSRIIQGVCIWMLSIICGWSVGYMSPLDNACVAARSYDLAMFTAGFRISIPITCLSLAATVTWLYWRSCYTAANQALSPDENSEDTDAENNDDDNNAINEAQPNQNNSNNTRCYLPLVELQHAHEEFSPIDGTITNPHIPNLHPNAHLIIQEFNRQMKLKRLMQCAPLVGCLLILCGIPLYCQVFLVIRHSHYDSNIDQHEASLFITTIMFGISSACLLFWVWVFKYTRKACAIQRIYNDHNADNF